MFTKNSFRTVNDFGLKNFFASVYAYLGLNILFSGIISFLIASNINKFAFLYPQGFFTVIGYMILLYVVLTRLYSLLINENSSWLQILPLLALFLAFEGLCFAPFLLTYKSTSIVFAASLAGLALIVMGAFGFFTSIDLSQYHNIFLIGVISISIVEFLSIFFFHFAINLQITSIGIIFAFLFFIANDMQMLKSLYYRNDIKSINKLTLLGSIIMFINFVVLLQRILLLFGDKKNE